MTHRSFKQRMAALEQALSPLERAHLLAERNTPPRLWPDAELEAYVTAHCQDLIGLSDVELEALINAETVEGYEQ